MTNPTPDKPVKAHLEHLPELDALRTLAVLMTLTAHYAIADIPYMWYGVPVFFTISGFLITTILLDTVDTGRPVAKLPVIKNFMIRRALRLFPAYYLFITIFFLAWKFTSLALWKPEFTPYFFTYTSNFLNYQIGNGNMSCFSHLWSLGVEEQFYLFWPWVLLFPPARFRVPVITLMILFSLGYIFTHYDNERIGALPFVNFHTLGVGALLAVFYVRRGATIEWLKTHRHLLFFISFVHLLLVLYLFKETSAGWHLYRAISLCLCTFAIVLVSVFGWKGFIGYLTRNKQVQYIGKISYGIYLYHMPVPFVWRAVAGKLMPGWHMSPVLFMLLCYVITILLAAISYKYIETRFLKLKRYFA